MATYIKIKIRRGCTSDWTTANPVLELGEIGADMDKHGLKVGNGTSRWSELPFCSPEIVNDLITGGTTSALSAEQGKELKKLVDGKASKTDLTKLETRITQIIQNGGVTVEDDFASRSKVNSISVNKAAELNDAISEVKDKVSGLGMFGMGYTIDNFNVYGRPTNITFEDGVTCELVWSGTVLTQIIASTGEVMTMNYNSYGTVTGRTITRS